jgi:hypothetical protein
LQSLQNVSNKAAPTPPAGYFPRKVLISSGIWRLDFSDLEAKGVGYARHRNPPKKR